MQLLVKQAPASGSFMDIGANIGTFLVAAARGWVPWHAF